MTPETLIDKYYADNPQLRHILLRHSTDVANMADDVARRHPELHADTAFMREAAMLHDIGCYLTDAPGISCHGTEPYIRHGLLGGELLRREGMPRHARVAERHTGTGLTAATIAAQQLPLPAADFVPETIEEQIICYADKFFSKSHLDRVRTPEQVLRSLERFGPEGLERMRQWIALFGV
ncbi:MAG: HDIG domain-containing protein [Bacteroidaceae bacterium]|nr:HDIG domain-containing protein [Bacteroidaceae bacterium]